MQKVCQFLDNLKRKTQQMCLFFGQKYFYVLKCVIKVQKSHQRFILIMGLDMTYTA